MEWWSAAKKPSSFRRRLSNPHKESNAKMPGQENAFAPTRLERTRLELAESLAGVFAPLRDASASRN
jgi:hypothetical protein